MKKPDVIRVDEKYRDRKIVGKYYIIYHNKFTRVSRDKLHFLKELILNRIKNVEIYLFGSRVDYNKKGGDIDVLILSKEKLSLTDKVQIRYSFFEKYGEQKLDLVNYKYDDKSNFKDLIMLDAVRI